MFDHAKCVSLLLKAEADPNIGDKMGRTPLHYASMFGSLLTIKSLVKYGAIIDTLDNHGDSAITLAKRGSNKAEVLKFLEDLRMYATDDGRTTEDSVDAAYTAAKALKRSLSTDMLFRQLSGRNLSIG